MPPRRPAERPKKTEFTVVLAGAGAQKIDVIKVVRELTGLGLKEARSRRSRSKPVKEGLTKATADEMKKKLVEAGATVESSSKYP